MDNDPANDIIHERDYNISKSHWTQLYRINGQLPSTHPLKNKMEYFGREYSLTVDASLTITHGPQVPPLVPGAPLNFV